MTSRGFGLIFFSFLFFIFNSPAAIWVQGNVDNQQHESALSTELRKFRESPSSEHRLPGGGILKPKLSEPKALIHPGFPGPCVSLESSFSEKAHRSEFQVPVSCDFHFVLCGPRRFASRGRHSHYRATRIDTTSPFLTSDHSENSKQNRFKSRAESN